jgi:hypothetical protein
MYIFHYLRRNADAINIFILSKRSVIYRKLLYYLILDAVDYNRSKKSEYIQFNDLFFVYCNATDSAKIISGIRTLHLILTKLLNTNFITY